MGHGHDRLQLHEAVALAPRPAPRAVAGLPKQVGIKFGLYFSNIDWEKQPENPWRNDNTLNEEGYMDYIHEQLKELLGGKYGEIARALVRHGQAEP